eukprot:scaffold34516_cov72-Phaeocystis_antarctica.AAC.1
MQRAHTQTSQQLRKTRCTPIGLWARSSLTPCRPLSSPLADNLLAVADAPRLEGGGRLGKVEAQVVQRAGEVGEETVGRAEAAVVVVLVGERAPDARAPRCLEDACRLESEPRHARPRPLATHDLGGHRRAGQPVTLVAPPADGAERLGVGPRDDGSARLVPRGEQPARRLGGARRRCRHLARRVGDAVVAFVQ